LSPRWRLTRWWTLGESPGAWGDRGFWSFRSRDRRRVWAVGRVPIHLWTQTSDTLNCSRLRELDYRCLAPVVARARHRGLRIQDQHRDAASGAHGLTPSVLNSARHLSSSLAVDLRSSTILLAGSSLPRLFFYYLGQGFELSAKPIKMFFVPFRLSKQLH
jgi:hypothetical protein